VSEMAGNKDNPKSGKPIAGYFLKERDPTFIGENSRGGRMQAREVNEKKKKNDGNEGETGGVGRDGRRKGKRHSSI